MSRSFRHSFSPAADDPAGPVVTLSTAQIEQAGLLEVLQAPGAMLMTGALLDGLLSDTSSDFLFREPLGQAREVKVALSGLFGRFVARAYLTHVHGYSLFDHVAVGDQMLDGTAVRVVRRRRGDLPDWLTWRPGRRDLTIAEAKGCHDLQPDKRLDAAWAQTQRIELRAGPRRLPVKRIAIVSRWGISDTSLARPQLLVRDPLDDGDATPGEVEQALVGVARGHYGRLLARLGHKQLGQALLTLRHGGPPALRGTRADTARQALEQTPVRTVETILEGGVRAEPGGWLGGMVLRSGPLAAADVSPAEQEALARLDLEAIFVGVEREIVAAVIEGQAATIETALKRSVADQPSADSSGTRITPIGDGQRVR